MRNHILPLGLSLLATASSLSAQVPSSQDARPADGVAGGSAPVLAADVLRGEIQVDGRLDDAPWSTVMAATGFVQREPDPGAGATRRTEARVLYGDDAVYVGVRLYDSPDSIAAQLSRRDDFGSYSDAVFVAFDSYNDNRTAFVFGANPRGVELDLMISEDQREDTSWDAVWEVETTTDSLGWVAEFRIPLSQLRYNPSEGVWGINFQRVIARHDEVSFWAATPPDAPGIVSRFGTLTGLGPLTSRRRLEIEPYVSSRVARAPGEAANPFYESTETGLSAGADLKYGLTPGLTVTATINPDFGQVEVDPAEVNLSAFETFFSEKRPFFVEGSDIFRFGEVGSYNNFNMEEYFYSRRIGRSPHRQLSGTYVDAPEATTILGAAKLSGKAGGWSIGFMDAVTAQEDGRYLETYVDADGDTLTRIESSPVEPRTNYMVGRVRRDLRDGATVVGGMVTATHRAMSDAFDPLLHPAAYFGGIDFEHSWNDEAWTLSGYASASRVEGSAEALLRTQRAPARYFDRPDADYLEIDPGRTALGGYLYELAIQRAGNLHFSVDHKVVSPGFEINDLGFQGRVDYRALTTLLGRRFPEPNGIFRSRLIYGYTYHAWNFGGDAFLHGGALGAEATLNNFWSGGITASYRPETLNDRLTRGGPLAVSPSNWELVMSTSSDSRKAISADGQLVFSRSDAGDRYFSAGLSFEARPSSSVRVDFGPTFARSHDTGQYVTSEADPLATETYGERYVFADIDQTTLGLETRLDWTLSPQLSLQLYLQPYVAAGDYSRFKEFLEPREYAFGVYGEDRGTISEETLENGRVEYTADPDGPGAAEPFEFMNPDFTMRSLRGNAVLRWEYRPGSELFVVWQQQRQGRRFLGDFEMQRDVGAILDQPATNVLMLKATYWLGS